VLVMTSGSHHRYLIAGSKEPSTQRQLFWSSRWGWVQREEAEVFTEQDRQFNSLPAGGRWVLVQDDQVRAA
jgi:hypothetical protein